MNIVKITFLSLVVAVTALSLPACKSRKIAAKPVQEAPPAEETAPPAEEAPAPAPAPKPEPAPVEKPDYNFSNIQFEFNSAVLKTFSYQALDKMATEMKKDPSVKFLISGHSSAEGTAEHNMSLSVDRANAVKAYLTNSGVDAANLTTKGFGESKPLNANKTESERSVNRRVEVKKAD